MTHEAGIEAALKADDRFGLPMYEELEAIDIESIIQAYLSASGMVLVPRKPTKEMCYVGQPTYDDPVSAYEIWGLMVDSAPNPFKSKP